MTTMTATEFVRNFSNVLDRLEHKYEEIIIVRNKHTVAKLVPGAPVMSAIDAFSDIYGILSNEDGKAWLKDCQGADKPLRKEMTNQWE